MKEKKRIPIKEFLEGYSIKGKIEDEYFNFYDYFCHKSDLPKRMEVLIKKLKILIKIGIIDEENTYCWFKNNMTMNGGLYDDCRISTLSERNPIGGFVLRPNEAVIFTVGLGKTAEYKFKNWMDLKRELKTNTEFKEMITNHFKSSSHNEELEAQKVEEVKKTKKTKLSTP